MKNKYSTVFFDWSGAVADILDEDLVHSFPSITSKEMPEYVDIVISALNEFIQIARASYGN